MQIFVFSVLKMSLEYCEKLLVNIRRNEVDHFEALTESRKFGVNLSLAVDFSQQKYMLECAVLKEILKVKEGPEKEKFQSMLDNSTKLLDLGVSRPKGYPCTFLGCMFVSSRYRAYLKHLKRIHPSAENYRCFFKQRCQRNFNSVDDLEEHVKVNHSQSRVSQHSDQSAGSSQLLQVSCKCNMLSCGEQIFNSTKNLALHINKVHRKENRICIFKNCERKFGAGSESRFHFQQKHFKAGFLTLKDVHLIASVSTTLPLSGESVENLGPDLNISSEASDNSVDEVSDDVDVDVEDDEKHFMMAYCDFINRLINYKFIPVSTVKDISSEFLKQSQQSSQSREASLRKSLSKVPNIPDEVLEQIVKENLNDPFVRAQEELSSEFRWKAYLEDNFTLVKPREIVLNPEEVKQGSPKDVIHYVPLLEAFKNLVEDKSFVTALNNSRNEVRAGDDDLIEDVSDGSAFKESKYFQDNPDAHALMMYSDGVELVNPLSSGKGKHKIVQLFWQVCEMPRFQRSTIDRLQLGLVFKEKLLKKYKYATILKDLVEDLAFLEREGVEVTEPIPRKVKASLLLYSGDNLESHLIGGFSASFSSKDICRHCHCQYNDLQEHISNFDGDSAHKAWTVLEYDSHECQDDVEAIPDVDARAGEVFGNIFTEFEEPDDEDSLEGTEAAENEIGTEDENQAVDCAQTNTVNYGVKSKCVFNKLEAFHCITSMPPDSLHDLMEGVLPQDLLGIIRILVQKNWFTLEGYNRALKTLKFSSQESSNKPQQVPSSPKVKKLSGKATSNWVHMRNFPLLLFLNDWIEDESDDVFKLAVMLHELTERITAETFRNYEIEALEQLLIDYFEHRKVVFNDYPILGRTKPKHHFLTHYPSYIKSFGPPSSYWTGRYESKHRVAKSTAEASKNFINISMTISQRQQYRQASTYFHGMFRVEKFILPVKVKTKQELSESEANIKQIMNSGDLLSTEIDFKCRKYKTGDLLVVKKSDKFIMEIGIVKGFLIKRMTVHVILRRCIMKMNSLRFYESSFISGDLDFINIEHLHDNYPLFMRGTEQKFILVPHHHISFSYD